MSELLHFFKPKKKKTIYKKWDFRNNTGLVDYGGWELQLLCSLQTIFLLSNHPLEKVTHDPHNIRHYCVTPHLWPTSCVWESTETYFSKTSMALINFISARVSSLLMPITLQTENPHARSLPVLLFLSPSLMLFLLPGWLAVLSAV